MKPSRCADADNEALIIERAAKGDAQSFAELYDAHVNRIYRYIFYRVSDVGTAEDLTQEVFLKGWRSLHRFKKTGSPFVAWLMTIAHNLVIDHYRSQKHRPTLLDETTPADPSTSPHQMAESKWNQQKLKEGVGKLKPEQQQVIMMRFIEGFDYVEVAAALGKSEGAIRVIQHRALKELKEILSKEMG
ncbi:MAG: sigma-70 family RNA polymerase sigma factor [Chloroflexota bacterium]|nr:sigma-70 family RNA polymerase sigma factor [Chloroflexota bacterium]